MIKHYYRISILGLSAGVLLFCHCAGSKQESTEKSETASTPPVLTEIIEDFDPATLGDYDIDETKPAPSSEGPVRIEDILKGSSQRDSVDTRPQSGYRVQIMSTRDEEEARAVRRDAILKFKENVYLMFDDPYYKVRVGDCISRFAADKLQEAAIAKGFLEAWVIRTNVQPQRPAETPGTEGTPSPNNENK
jgi:hypothetical protein